MYRRWRAIRWRRWRRAREPRPGEPLQNAFMRGRLSGGLQYLRCDGRGGLEWPTVNPGMSYEEVAFGRNEGRPDQNCTAADEAD